MFVNVPSLLIVMVGSMFVVLMKFTLGQFLGAIKVAIKAFSFKLTAPADLITEVVELADEARKGGLLAPRNCPKVNFINTTNIEPTMTMSSDGTFTNISTDPPDNMA